jgi:hypothetical protein
MPVAAAELGERLIKAVKQHSIGRPPHDDIALVCFGRTAGTAPAAGPAR